VSKTILRHRSLPTSVCICSSQRSKIHPQRDGVVDKVTAYLKEKTGKDYNITVVIHNENSTNNEKVRVLGLQVASSKVEEVKVALRGGGSIKGLFLRLKEDKMEKKNRAAYKISVDNVQLVGKICTGTAIHGLDPVKAPMLEEHIRTAKENNLIGKAPTDLETTPQTKENGKHMLVHGIDQRDNARAMLKQHFEDNGEQYKTTEYPEVPTVSDATFTNNDELSCISVDFYGDLSTIAQSFINNGTINGPIIDNIPSIQLGTEVPVPPGNYAAALRGGDSQSVHTLDSKLSKLTEENSELKSHVDALRDQLKDKESDMQGMRNFMNSQRVQLDESTEMARQYKLETDSQFATLHKALEKKDTLDATARKEEGQKYAEAKKTRQDAAIQKHERELRIEKQNSRELENTNKILLKRCETLEETQKEMTQTQVNTEAATKATEAGLEAKMLARLEAQAIASQRDREAQSIANQQNMEQMAAQMKEFMKANNKISVTPRKAKRTRRTEQDPPASPGESSDEDEPMKAAARLLEEDPENMDFDNVQVQPQALLFNDEDGELLSQNYNTEMTATQLADGLGEVNIGSQDDSNNNGEQQSSLRA
jgi:myosin heavy subunit